uniref:Charged multivesicular body protein 5 n=1 Tax=Triticum urartu TaxID=4572 RepID=A0A8R7JWF0_TRIUA
MTAMKAANKELKGMMKTVRIEDIDSMQDEMMDLMDVSNEIQETLGRSYSVPDDIDEEELICSWPFLDDSNTRFDLDVHGWRFVCAWKNSLYLSSYTTASR